MFSLESPKMLTPFQLLQELLEARPDPIERWPAVNETPQVRERVPSLLDTYLLERGSERRDVLLKLRVP